MEIIPEVSVCVLTYNHESYVRQALDSLVNQKTNFNYEILVSDDASSDHTVSIIRAEYIESVKLYTHEENCGLCRNMYDILQRAQGKYVALVAGDDYVLTDHYLQIHYDFMQKADESVVGVTSRLKIVDEMGVEQRAIIPHANVFTLNEFLWKDMDIKYSEFVRNIFQEKNMEWLYLASRNNDEIAFPFWILSHGDIAVIPEYLNAYRSVQKKGGSNYNSLFDVVDTYCIVKDASKYMAEKVSSQYTFQYLMGAYAYETACFVISNIIKRRNMSYLKKWIQRCGWKPFVKGTWLIPLLRLSGGRYPEWYRKIHSLIRKK